jgi:hypothetical protein
VRRAEAVTLSAEARDVCCGKRGRPLATFCLFRAEHSKGLAGSRLETVWGHMAVIYRTSLYVTVMLSLCIAIERGYTPA